MGTKKRRVMNMPELAETVIDIVGMRYEAMEKAFGSIDEPMMRAFKVGSEPMVSEVRSFMSKHRRSGRTIASFNPGTVLFDSKSDMFYFKFGFDLKKGGFPALILEYGDSGSPMRMPNKAYFFLYWSSKNHVQEVYDRIQGELTRMLAEMEG